MTHAVASKQSPGVAKRETRWSRWISGCVEWGHAQTNPVTPPRPLSRRYGTITVKNCRAHSPLGHVEAGGVGSEADTKKKK
jgi:hypothetical protein